MPPKVLARNADRTGGVLPVPAAARSAPKPPAVRLKLEVRRLPPGLTLTEFEETLGDEWKLNNGKVDWREYRQGKTRAPGSGKVPEQSRCYVHVVNEACVGEFEKRFLDVVFHDKAGTHKNPDLKHLPPTLGFAPNQRTPLQQAKNRTDNRQGTIDQDPEFIAFLEAETQPISKPSALDFGSSDKENEKKEVKTTPLIEDLRERKANKAKAAQAKAEKAEKEKKERKSAEKEGEKDKGKDGKGTQQHQKVEQAAKDAAKALNKQAASKQQQAQQAKQTPSPAKSKKQAAAQQSPKQQNANTVPTGPASPAPQRGPQRQRGNADGIKKMLQKDLGIKPKADAAASTTSNQSKAASSASTPATPTTQTSAASKGAAQSKTAPSPAPSQDPKSTPSTTKAYLKHANPSQGMTEMLIQQALAAYGEMGNVTIDPRKGTAIAVFKTAEGLKKALEAKKVGVANGAVEVLEFRERAGGGGGGGGGGRGGFRGRGGRGARGGGNAASAAAGSGNAAAAAGGGAQGS